MKLASTIQVSLPKYSKFLLSLSSIHSFVCFPNSLKYYYSEMLGANKMCTVMADIM